MNIRPSLLLQQTLFRRAVPAFPPQPHLMFKRRVTNLFRSIPGQSQGQCTPGVGSLSQAQNCHAPFYFFPFIAARSTSQLVKLETSFSLSSWKIQDLGTQITAHETPAAVPGSLQECRFSRLTSMLLNQSLHFNKISGDPAPIKV